jgi:hypothetical protein
VLSLLAQHQVPLGSESKYFNAIAFFDFVVDRQDLQNVPRKGQVGPSGT